MLPCPQGCVTLLASMWDNMHRVLTTWKVHCQEFLLGLYYIGIIYWKIAYIIELNFQPLSLTQRSSWDHVVQSSNHMVGLSGMGCPHMSHLSINYQVWSKGPTMNNKTLQSLRKFQGFRGRTGDKGQTSLWAEIKFFITQWSIVGIEREFQYICIRMLPLLTKIKPEVFVCQYNAAVPVHICDC